MAAAPATSSETASTASLASIVTTKAAVRTALVIDGSYAMIGARSMGGKIDYVKLRAALEELAGTEFNDCWFFDQNPADQRPNPDLTAEYHRLKFARPDGPQFQVSLFPMKKYKCHCKKCGNHFSQNVQKGVDNGIATKILSLAYENICDRFILFAGDGDFYSSLSHVRNVLRKDIWVVGYRGTVSGDLQPLASRVIWMKDLWSQVKNARQVRPREQSRREEVKTDTPGWFEDHEGEDVQLGNGSSTSQIDGCQEDIGSGRQVVIAPLERETSSRSNHSTRGKGRDRVGRQNGRTRGKNGRGRSRSRSRDRPRADQQRNRGVAAARAARDIEDIAVGVPTVAEKPTKKSSAEGNRGARGGNGKKRKRNENNERGRSKRGGRGGEKAGDVPVVTLSDISSDEGKSEPFPLSLPVLRPVTAAQAMATQETEGLVDEIGCRTQVIDLASDTESE